VESADNKNTENIFRLSGFFSTGQTSYCTQYQVLLVLYLKIIGNWPKWDSLTPS